MLLKDADIPHQLVDVLELFSFCIGGRESCFCIDTGVILSCYDFYTVRTSLLVFVCNHISRFVV